jgi:V8-like Glu-specific endopeptidase
MLFFKENVLKTKTATLVSFLLFGNICFGAEEEVCQVSTEISTPRLIEKLEIKKEPYSSLLSIVCDFDVGETVRQTGTGFLIGNNSALTAAHVLLYNGEKPKKVSCYLSRHGDSFYKEIKIKKYILCSEYVEKEKSSSETAQYDYALIDLDIDEPYNGYTIDLDIVLEKNFKKLMLLGYPGQEYHKKNKFAHLPYEVSLKVYDGYKKDIISFRNELYGGMSGGPIIFKKKEKYKVGGLFVSNIVGKDSDKFFYSLCCRFTEEKIKKIFKWKELIKKDLSLDEVYAEVSSENGISGIISDKSEKGDCGLQ